MVRRRRNYRAVMAVYAAYFLTILVVFGKHSAWLGRDPDDLVPRSSSPDRRLLAVRSNCTPRSVDEFPADFMSLEEKLQGGILFHILVAIYLFMALAIVCDDYFVSSLEQICEVLKLKHDVAGATFMAAGSSAPELFTSVIGVFIAKSDVGVSTIVGSAVFNVLCIVALVGIFGGMVIQLTWWPLFRDCIVYCLSIIALIVVLQDGFVHWYEALVFLVLYAGYITLLYFNDRMEFLANKYIPMQRLMQRDTESTPLIGGADIRGTEEEYFPSGQMKLDETADSEINEEYESPFTVPDSFIKRCYWVCMLPVTILCFLTIPDCRRPGCCRKLFFLTFLGSVVWIAGMSYVLVWMVCLSGDTLGIPDTVMGLTLLAAGTSIPDAMSSIFVARDGYGDMAVSNSIGSNIFDILICLGLPWMLQTGFIKPGATVEIISSGMIFTSITLLTTVIILCGSVMLNKWRLNKALGFLFFIVYVIVMTFASLYELNIFGDVNLPSCARL